MCEFNRIAFIAESKSTVCSKYSIALCRFNYQIFNSHTAVFDCFLRGAGNITEAPPVADEARRCWRKTRSIAPAPRAIGDYVLRGLNGLRSKTHEAVSFERSEFTGECAELPTKSRRLSTAARHRCVEVAAPYNVWERVPSIFASFVGR